ncbi:MAG: hypothetical protein CMH91_11840 [Oceanicaulis sp.]|uniref:hypothetical protein n=1 Tax=unclassified Oceanicaulis TaxID=2632123 RepID=UPI000C401AFC|nr:MULTISPECIES: hypothetical protein [unclassified Oceanicaulis]MAB70503.1 hypothetical protein [Oceanicaulis sp.]MBC39735.1 hypothetical protein [Oceanicaulis sp.]MBG35778.1 hypothetical protein [Oceanicaulis sp.]HBU60884.1 hypothetical protein [Oceanicaulis sp.]
MIGFGPELVSGAPADGPVRLDVNGLRPDLWPRNGVRVEPDPLPAPFTPARLINTGGETWHRCNVELKRPLRIGETVWIRVRTADGTSQNRRIGPMGPGSLASLLTGPLSNLEVTREQIGPLTLVSNTALPDGSADLVLRYECQAEGVEFIAVGPETNIIGRHLTVYYFVAQSA